MARIQVLPPGLVNQIAAGEVVERPASVVKELVENALDAGARAISVDVEDGGLSLVRVADDGSGMDREDALLALERHATSKLRDADGLAAIATMGFRGEAIPAIASVSRFRVDTAPADDGAGTRIDVEGGALGDVAAVARPRGTTIEVRELFFNTPARRKFMRAPATEAGHVTEAVIRLALARPEVSFNLRSASRLVLAARAGAGLADRAAQALGREAHRHLVPVDARRGDVRVHGVVCSPDHSEATGRSLYLFVNGRYVRDRGAAHAVLRAFAGTLPPGRHPAGVLFVDLPLGRVDVNVHPQKLEVRFAEGREVYDAIFHAIAGTLRTTPWLRRPVPAAGAGLSAPPGASAEPPSDGVLGPESPRAGEEAAAVLAWSRATPDAAATERGATGASERFAFPIVDAEGGARPAGYFASLRYVGQHARTYLLCEAPGGSLVVIDQHASHERMLFHRLREAFRTRRIPVQPFLLPQVVTLQAAVARALEGGLEELGRLGFDVEPFGGDSFAVKGAPAALSGVDLTALLGDLAAQLEQLERTSAVDDAFHDLLATMACHAAVRANQDLAAEEARALLDGLDAIDFKARCPHGRPVVFELPLADLERRVGRR
ncbi:DNA mismatch repair endonuclease MutL [Anaeromyxobacter oryzae]|uniref:DNA mismatch repair protein MutL n=1 Tax=Anaeromyxobacter oryzae TaxID=2918170 RepID=A0ABN6N052_9BACT|nr:DNA mismatch repair endonuclease MutL [Anaeromyxobacter oryzae]BDG06587.1 DNA mismatch repair protein MutL [Anaeromyxobacter oryzae]